MNCNPFDSLTTHSAIHRYHLQGHNFLSHHISTYPLCSNPNWYSESGMLIHRLEIELLVVRHLNLVLQSTLYGSPGKIRNIFDFKFTNYHYLK